MGNNNERPNIMVENQFSLDSNGEVRLKTIVYRINYPIEEKSDEERELK